jgi:hypothetical protein
MKLKHSACVVVAISLALCGCVDKTSSGAAGVKNIGVRVEGGRIVVKEERAVVTADIGTIVWNLPTESKYLFPRDGIVIDPGNFSPCAPTAGGKDFTCVKRGHRLGRYKYIVNVNDGSKPLAPLPLPPLDPWVYNDIGGGT